ncbi:MAG TPA: M23 family metallopeptidase, partial [Thermodesulfobacteriota bacterium]|nr:M23 family metallopeptidase [Thermodesulfobacteriota bacterium]
MRKIRFFHTFSVPAAMGSGYSLFLFILFIIILVNACARHRVPTERSPRLQENRIERKGVYHTVERHQTLYRICKTYGVDIQEVARLNGITVVSKIQTGQKIFIPGAEEVLKVEIYVDDVVKEPVDKERGKTTHEELDFIWPVEGRCIALFEDEERKMHQGIDISSLSGTPIKASNAGRVIYSGNTIRGYGNLIILRHSGGFVSVYAHNQTNLVEEGVWVGKGQIIGKVGQTGRASGPHLHFEIRKNNKAV